MRKLIIFLICKKLGVKKYEDFRFTNQKSIDIYYFTDINLMKKTETGFVCPSRVAFNWLLDKDCKVHKVSNMVKFKELVDSGN